MSLSFDDAQKLVQFLRFLDENKELMVGYNTKVPVETYIMIGSLTVLVFDYLITFDREVNYVWSSPWSLGLPLFYINRYIPFVDLALFIHIQFSYLTNEHVSVATWLVSFPSFFGQMIIVLRTCALWQNNRLIVSFLLLVSCATLTVTSFFTAKILANMICLSLSNIIVPLTKLPYVYKQCLRLPQHVFHSMFCNRVVFQLFEYRYHAAHRRQHRASTTLSGQDPSTEQYISTDNYVSSVFLDNITAKTDDVELATLPSSRATTSGDRDDWIT
ncbi:hypothetical protein MD484_g397, partial [Candolleomyces efflorescens]